MSNLLRFKPFPREVFPDSLAEYIQQAAASVDCDESMIAVPMLPVIAAAVGSSTRLAVKPDWIVPSILWTCTVAKSGSAKSPAMKLAVRFLRKVQDRFDQEHELAAESHRPEALRHEAALKSWKSDGCIGDMPSEPVVPVHRRVLTTDGTLAGLADMLSRDPSGKLFFADELAGWLVGMSKFNTAGDDSNSWNELYDGQSFWHDRKVAKSLRVRFPALSVCGGLQPERLFTTFSRDNLESGLAARVLFFRPPARERKLTDISVPVELVDQVANRLEALAERQPSTAGTLTWEPDLVGLERSAFAEFRVWHDRVQKELARTEGAFNSALAKLTGTALRVALVLFCYRYPNAVQTGREVDAAAIRAGMTVADWFANEAARMYQASELGVDDRLATEVVEVLQSFGPMTIRDMQHRKRVLRDQPADQLEKIVAALVPTVLGMEVVNTGGRPSVVYSLKAGNETTGTVSSGD
jgi:hypothetical protein